MELCFYTETTYAVALEGGGAKGAYQVGVWQALEEAGVKYNAVSGTSVGALNGALMTMRDLPAAIRCWQLFRHRWRSTVRPDYQFPGLSTMRRCSR